MKAPGKSKLDKAQAQEFRRRWQAVERIRQQETRNATLELRWQQLNAAYVMAQHLRLSAGHSDETQVHQRWARLKENARNPRKV